MRKYTWLVFVFILACKKNDGDIRISTSKQPKKIQIFEVNTSSSAETLLHCHIYRRCPEAGVVLHTHSLSQTVASRLYAPAGRIELAGYELLKAFAGLDTHETRLDLPVFPNSQDMQALVAIIDAYWASTPIQHGYLIDGHGIYAWGRDMLEAMRHLDAFDYLIRCELELRKLSR